MYFCVLYNSENEKSYVFIEYWWIGFYNRDGVCLFAIRSESCNVIQVNVKYLK
jgi:hypothetical protein